MSSPKSRTRRGEFILSSHRPASRYHIFFKQYSPGPTTPHLRWQTARGWSYPERLQYPKGVHPPPRTSVRGDRAPSAYYSQLFCSLRGGAKKRKKKTYNTPKKIKHKRKKVKMPILKYYKVDSNGKIQRLRRECPVRASAVVDIMLVDA